MLPDPYNRLPAEALHPVNAQSGEVLFRQGAATKGLFVVRSGLVHLERVGPNGERIIIHRASAGTSFAEASVFSDHYHCDAMAVGVCRLWRIDAAAVQAAFVDPVFATSYARAAARQIQVQRQILEIVAIRSARDRVLAGLVAGLLDETVVEFAARVHLTPEATFRALRALVEEGRIENPSRGVYQLAPPD